MSHCPGYKLEDFLIDYYGVVDKAGEYGDGYHRICKGRLILSKEQFFKLVDFFESSREVIEDLLLDYNEEENGSWRDYRNFTIVNYISEENNKSAQIYLKSIENIVEKTKGLR